MNMNVTWEYVRKNKSDYDKLEWYTIIHISMGIYIYKYKIKITQNEITNLSATNRGGVPSKLSNEHTL